MKSAIATRPCQHLLVYDTCPARLFLAAQFFRRERQKTLHYEKCVFVLQGFEMSRIAPQNAAGVVAVQEEMVFGELQPGQKTLEK
jgi:hypothetical protein